MKTFCDQLLTRPALANHQNRTAHRRRSGSALDRIEKGAGLADKLVVTLHFPTYSEKSQ